MCFSEMRLILPDRPTGRKQGTYSRGKKEKRGRELGIRPANLHLVEPQPYLEFNYLVRHAKAVITDSGGITEEASVMGVPCMTLRDTTERPETVSVGTNVLVGTDPERLGPVLDRLFAGDWQRGGIPPLWDGRAGERIVAALEGVLVGEDRGEQIASTTHAV